MYDKLRKRPDVLDAANTLDADVPTCSFAVHTHNEKGCPGTAQGLTKWLTGLVSSKYT